MSVVQVLRVGGASSSPRHRRRRARRRSRRPRGAGGGRAAAAWRRAPRGGACARRTARTGLRHQTPVDDRVRPPLPYEARPPDRRVDGVRGVLGCRRGRWCAACRPRRSISSAVASLVPSRPRTWTSSPRARAGSGATTWIRTVRGTSAWSRRPRSSCVALRGPRRESPRCRARGGLLRTST